MGVFGQERVASNYMIFDGTPGAIGSLFFAKYLAQSVYQAHESPGSSTCKGDACFQLSHAVMTMAALVGLLLGVVLAMRTRYVYRHLLGNDKDETGVAYM